MRGGKRGVSARLEPYATRARPRLCALGPRTAGVTPTPAGQCVRARGGALISSCVSCETKMPVQRWHLMTFILPSVSGGAARLPRAGRRAGDHVPDVPCGVSPRRIFRVSRSARGKNGWSAFSYGCRGVPIFTANSASALKCQPSLDGPRPHVDSHLSLANPTSPPSSENTILNTTRFQFSPISCRQHAHICTKRSNKRCQDTPLSSLHHSVLSKCLRV